MERRRIGDSDLVCSALGFGAWEMGNIDYGRIDIDEAGRTVSAAIDSGITLFDTAEVYGPFTSEELLGKALGSRRKEITLVTKVGFGYDAQENCVSHDCSHANVARRLEGCLRRLRTDYVDLLLIHWPDHQTPHEETMAALEELKSAGKIRHYGVSNYSAPMMEACQRFGHIVANQVGYNLFDRRMETLVLPYCAAHNVGFMAYGSLAYGLLTGALTPATTFQPPDWRSGAICFGLPLFQREHFLKELQVVEQLKALAARRGRTVAQLAIAWVLGNPAVSVALAGVKTRSELAENVQAVEWKLAAEDRADIDRIFADVGVSTYKNVPQALH